MIEINLPYPPSANRLWRTNNGRQYTPKSVKSWKRIAGLLAKGAGAVVTDGPVRVSITLHPKTTRTGQASKTRIDLDNAIKATLDGLNGIAWRDDKQVVKILALVGRPLPGGGLTVSAGLME